MYCRRSKATIIRKRGRRESWIVCSWIYDAYDSYSSADGDVKRAADQTRLVGGNLTFIYYATAKTAAIYFHLLRNQELKNLISYTKVKCHKRVQVKMRKLVRSWRKIFLCDRHFWTWRKQPTAEQWKEEQQLSWMMFKLSTGLPRHVSLLIARWVGGPWGNLNISANHDSNSIWHVSILYR